MPKTMLLTCMALKKVFVLRLDLISDSRLDLRFRRGLCLRKNLVYDEYSHFLI